MFKTRTLSECVSLRLKLPGQRRITRSGISYPKYEICESSNENYCGQSFYFPQPPAITKSIIKPPPASGIGIYTYISPVFTPNLFRF